MEDLKEFMEEINSKIENRRYITDSGDATCQKDVERLFHKLQGLLLKLQDADIMAMTIDVLVARKILSSRSSVADARIDYGNPWEYEYANKKVLLGYKGGVDNEEVKQRIFEG